MPVSSQAFKGLSFPVIKRPLGFFQTMTGIDTIKASIQQILGTRLGERVMVPDFGSRTYELAFEQNDSVFQTLVEEFVVGAIRKWEPRIDILGVIIDQLPNTNEARIVIQYRIHDETNREDALVLSLDRERGVVVTDLNSTAGFGAGSTVGCA